MIEHTYEAGYVDYYERGRASNRVAIKWRIEGGEFAMQGEVWRADERDALLCGQCLDEIAELMPDDPKVQRMVKIWRRWHLNYMNAGSPAQEEFLRIHKDEKPHKQNHYEWAKEALAGAGLQPDPDYIHNGKPYSYGSAWLREELPEDVLAEIKSWV